MSDIPDVNIHNATPKTRTQGASTSTDPALTHKQREPLAAYFSVILESMVIIRECILRCRLLCLSTSITHWNKHQRADTLSLKGIKS